MRTYPKSFKELEMKHSFSLPLDKQNLERVRSNIILRHDIAFLFLKFRILNSLKEHKYFGNELFHDSFLDRKFNNGDRIKIYNAIKGQIPFPLKKDNKLSLIGIGYEHVFGRVFKNETPQFDTKAQTIRDFIYILIRQNREDIKGEFELIFKSDLQNACK